MSKDSDDPEVLYHISNVYSLMSLLDGIAANGPRPKRNLREEYLFQSQNSYEARVSSTQNPYPKT